MYELELISHSLCPFNQRLVITLLMKGLKRDQDFSVKYFDLANIPDWFKKISPMGEMPVLNINNSRRLYQTTPINEYLNEYASGNLLPEDGFDKAKDRCWIEYSSRILNTLREVFTSKEKEAFDNAIDRLFNLFESVERHLDKQSKYWKNQHYSLVDGAFIPAFTLMFHFDYLKNHPKWSMLTNTAYWANQLLNTTFATESICPNFDHEFEHFFQFTGSQFKLFTQ